MGTILYHGAENLIKNLSSEKALYTMITGEVFTAPKILNWPKNGPAENKQTVSPISMSWTCLVLNV